VAWMTFVTTWSSSSMGMEQSAHDELDAILKRGLSQDDRKRIRLEVKVEGANMYISVED
jgi:hypothetical protein